MDPVLVTGMFRTEGSRSLMTFFEQLAVALHVAPAEVRQYRGLWLHSASGATLNGTGFSPVAFDILLPSTPGLMWMCMHPRALPEQTLVTYHPCDGVDIEVLVRSDTSAVRLRHQPLALGDALVSARSHMIMSALFTNMIAMSLTLQ